MQGTPETAVPGTDPQAEQLQMQIDVGNEQELKNLQKDNKNLEVMVKDFFAKPLLEAKVLTEDQVKGADASALKLAHEVMKALIAQGIGKDGKTNAPPRSPTDAQSTPKPGQIPQYDPKTQEVKYA